MSILLRQPRQLLGMARGWALTAIPGWTDDSHRDLLQRHGATAVGHRISATTMTLQQLNAALADYEARGWVRSRTWRSGTVKQAVPAPVKKLVRMWFVLAEAGQVASSSRTALLAWCARQVKRPVTSLDALSAGEQHALIEQLKRWADRAPAAAPATHTARA